MLPSRPALRALAALAALAATTTAQDPFQPGLRWSRSASPTQPWVPRDVAFVGDGELTLAAPAVGTPSVELLASAELAVGGMQPLASSGRIAGALGPVRVAAGDEPDELFDVVQVPAPTAANRATVLTRRDPRPGAPGGSLSVRWSVEVGPRGNGPAWVAASRDGAFLVVASFDAGSASLWLAALEPATGGALWSTTLPATGLGGLTVADTADRIAVAAGTRRYVVDALGGTLLALQDPDATGAIALSADGTRVAFGGAAGIDVYEDLGVGYVPLLAHPGGPDEVATRAALSADGSTLAVTWWNARTALGVRAELLEPSSGAVLATFQQNGAGVAGLQNYPSALALTPDGARAAIGLWGVGDARPELLLVDRDGTTLLSADLPGSVEALALSEDGTRLAVARRDTHANQFTTTGAVELFDTGERDLQLVGAARPGGTLDLEFELQQPAGAVFALGSARAQPWMHALGPIWVDFAQPHVLRSVGGPATRVALHLSVPLDPALVGAPLVAQALALLPTGASLSRTVVRPRIL